MLCDNMVLGYYNINEKIRPVALDSKLIQFQTNDPRIIFYASKSLSHIEKYYWLTQKEAFVIIWVVERFNVNIYYKQF